MPIADIQDAREVEHSLRGILSATDADGAAQAVRTLFVEILDYDYEDLRVPLNGADANLPSDARLLARRGGISALYIPLDGADGNRVTGAVAAAAARVTGDTIADEPLLLFTSRDRDELHVIYPDLSGSRPSCNGWSFTGSGPAAPWYSRLPTYGTITACRASPWARPCAAPSTSSP